MWPWCSRLGKISPPSVNCLTQKLARLLATYPARSIRLASNRCTRGHIAQSAFWKFGHHTLSIFLIFCAGFMAAHLQSHTLVVAPSSLFEPFAHCWCSLRSLATVDPHHSHTPYVCLWFPMSHSACGRQLYCMLLVTTVFLLLLRSFAPCSCFRYHCCAITSPVCIAVPVCVDFDSAHNASSLASPPVPPHCYYP